MELSICLIIGFESSEYKISRAYIVRDLACIGTPRYGFSLPQKKLKKNLLNFGMDFVN